MSEAAPNSSELVVPKDRLTLVRVTSLFGIFDHEIPLNLESGVTIIHGSNGVGKTIILEMIRALLSGTSEIFLRVPYEEFSLAFQSGDSIKVATVTAADGHENKSLNYTVTLNGQLQTILGEVDLDPELIRKAKKYFEESWKYLGRGKWQDARDGEIVPTGTLCRRHGVPDSLREKLAWRRDQVLEGVLERFAKKCRLRFIGTDRLLASALDRSSERAVDRPSIESVEATHVGTSLRIMLDGHTLEQTRGLRTSRTIDVYAQDLRRRVRNALTEYGKITERLDRSLVPRLVSKQQPMTTADQLLPLFKALDDRRRTLIDLGLLPVAEDIVGKDATDVEVRELVSQSTDVFSLYVHDMNEKLAVFEQLQNKLEILRGRTDQRFQFKKLVFNSEEGFVFRSDSGATVAAADLSSGEQHEMILMYELLFMVEDGDLVLIDEPEISLHVEWQMEFLSDLKEVLRASNIDVLLATHSVAIARVGEHGLVRLGSRGRSRS